MPAARWSMRARRCVRVRLGARPCSGPGLWPAQCPPVDAHVQVLSNSAKAASSRWNWSLPVGELGVNHLLQDLQVDTPRFEVSGHGAQVEQGAR